MLAVISWLADAVAEVVDDIEGDAVTVTVCVRLALGVALGESVWLGVAERLGVGDGSTSVKFPNMTEWIVQT